jgi:hypothetical protein
MPGIKQAVRMMVHRTTYLGALAVIALACLRLCHVHWLWSDEDYHLAAAIRILHGQIPYRDFWYDKPPLAAFYYLLIGGYSGWPLRLLDAAYVLVACFLAYRLAFSRMAALLLAFFLAFYLPAAVIPFAPDALLIVPHLAAVYFATQRRAFSSGACCGIGFLVNLKAAFILPVCALWLMAELPLLAAGFAAPLLAAALSLVLTGAWPGFYEQAWQWGILYAHGAPVAHPLQLGLTRVFNWLGFHAALLLGAILFFIKTAHDRLRFAAWIALSFAAVCFGNHFAPRYFLQLLPPLVVVAARGFACQPRALPALALLLLIPAVRFGPRYAIVALGHDPNWPDVALDRDSRQAAAIVQKSALPGDTLFVWGYRPDLYVYTRRMSDSRFWDSQPLTGVPADRHLTESQSILGSSAARHRAQFVQSSPTFFIDGLGSLNPALDPRAFPEVRQWMLQYELVARTRLCLIYRKIAAK